MTVDSGITVDLSGKRILVTHADRFMGPVLCGMVAQSGAELIASNDDLSSSGEVSQLIESAGQIDCLIANLAMPAPQTLATDVSDAEWSEVFKTMVDPLHWLTRAVLPQMIERRQGKILVMGSASALRGINKTSSFASSATGGSANGGGQGGRFFATCRRIHKKGPAKEARKAVSLCEPCGGVTKALVADTKWTGALRAEDAVSGWNDARDLRSTGFHCKIGGADSEAESEPGALPWGFRSGRPSVEQPLA